MEACILSQLSETNCNPAHRNSSQHGDIVLDFFSGSGSTLMTCAQRTGHTEP
ncbi:DNA methyltransferase [Paenibacillus sp. Soil522]|uniref:DNA methyltransferase n=1 Tax=Paenibacillus sp. Soil522 TaxID=1736388 RepID=UPI002E13B270